jgi:hypothetical protein
MTDRNGRTPSAFRLNLEQQKNRAKDLLRAARAADPEAVARLVDVAPLTGRSREAGSTTAAAAPRTWKLADAQLAIARELRFSSWANLKVHVAAMDRQRAAIGASEPAPDADLKTLHIRCGSDIRDALNEAGFRGDFLEHSIPYCHGPVTQGPDRYELMARFLVGAYPQARDGLVYERELEGLQLGEQRLRLTADDYERVVLWMEHDSYDQLVLARLLAHYANAPRPRVLELICVREFPGGQRFIGIGQLPAEALRLLWPTRVPVTDAMLALGDSVWDALGSADPRSLAWLARSGTPALPVMAGALHRHLRELPSVDNGLGLTECLILQILSEIAPVTLNRVFYLLVSEREPLPWMGDLGVLHVVEDMLRASQPVFTRSAPPPDERWFSQQLTITDLGRAVLRGEVDWQSLRPPSRWVGGVHVQPGSPGWRWDEKRATPVMSA